jgi:hypothetical protein
MPEELTAKLIDDSFTSKSILGNVNKVGDSIDSVITNLSINIPVPISAKDYHTDKISPSGDVDDYQVELGDNIDYVFEVSGYSEAEGNGDLFFDPTLTLYDPNGNQVAYGVDPPYIGLSPKVIIAFSPSSDGLYTLSVAGDGTETGDYGLATSYSVLG